MLLMTEQIGQPCEVVVWDVRQEAVRFLLHVETRWKTAEVMCN